MINTLRKQFLILIAIAVPVITFAQSNLTASVADSTTIEGQFEYLYKKSNTYQDYKVVPISAFNTLKQNATDSIRLYKKEATNHLQEIISLKSKLETSTTEMDNLKEELSTTQNAQNSINLIGMAVGKNTYRIIMWGVIFCLAFFSVVLYLMYKRGHEVVKEAKTRQIELQEELVNLRKSGILREQKLGHELMTLKLRNK